MITLKSQIEVKPFLLNYGLIKNFIDKFGTNYGQDSHIESLKLPDGISIVGYDFAAKKTIPPTDFVVLVSGYIGNRLDILIDMLEQFAYK